MSGDRVRDCRAYGLPGVQPVVLIFKQTILMYCDRFYGKRELLNSVNSLMNGHPGRPDMSILKNE